MLADRSYMRDQYFDVRYSLTVKVIITLVIAFVLQQVAILYFHFNVDHFLGLSRAGLAKGWAWQLLSYSLLHSGPWPWHLLGNCLAIYFFGRSIEESLGPRRFLLIFLTGIVVGGALQVVTSFFPEHFDSRIIGASAGAMALFSAYASLFPGRDFTVFIYFLPVTVRVQVAFVFVLLLSIFGTLIPFGGIAHAAHLGGLLYGLYQIRYGFQLTRPSWLPSRTKPAPRPTAYVTARKAGSWKSQKVLPAEEIQEDFISKEVDPILDKISAHGIHSLTDQEREILDKARKKMGKKQ